MWMISGWFPGGQNMGINRTHIGVAELELTFIFEDFDDETTYTLV